MIVTKYILFLCSNLSLAKWCPNISLVKLKLFYLIHDFMLYSQVVEGLQQRTLFELVRIQKITVLSKQVKWLILNPTLQHPRIFCMLNWCTVMLLNLYTGMSIRKDTWWLIILWYLCRSPFIQMICVITSLGNKHDQTELFILVLNLLCV